MYELLACKRFLSCVVNQCAFQCWRHILRSPVIKKAAKGPQVLFSDFRNLFAGMVLPTVPADECAQNGGACLRQQRGGGRLPAALFHTRSPHLLMCPGSG